MRAKISKWGNSLGLRLPRKLADAAGLTEGQVVELSTSGMGLQVKPVNAVPRYRLEELLAEAEQLGPDNRPAFEDWGILPSEWPDDDWSDIAPTDQEMGVENAVDRRSASRRR